jgi:hypothetical protein
MLKERCIWVKRRTENNEFLFQKKEEKKEKRKQKK